jgi:hypothetical protein
MATPGDWGAPTVTTVSDLSVQDASGGVHFTWSGLQQVLDMPENARAAIDAAVESAMDKLAAEMEQYAKDNAPWRDRTGDARAGLHADVSSQGGVFAITLAYDVYYGFYLETHNGGEFAIVTPTVQLFASKVMGAVLEELR